MVYFFFFNFHYIYSDSLRGPPPNPTPHLATQQQDVGEATCSVFAFLLPKETFKSLKKKRIKSGPLERFA